MRITGITCRRVEVSRRGGWLFVQVETDAGLTGLGEASQGGDDAAVAETIERRLAPWLDRQEPPGRRALLAALRLPGGLPGRGDGPLRRGAGPVGPGRAGGRAARLAPPGRAPAPPPVGLRQHQPLHLGPLPRGVRRQRQAGGRGRASAPSSWPPSTTSPAWTPRRPSPPSPWAIDRVLAVREAVGPEVQVLVDCHCHFNAAWAVRVARRLEPARLYWYEDPVPRSDPEGLLRVRQSIEQPVAAGETFFGRRPFWDLFTPGGGGRGHAGREALRRDPGAAAHRRPGRAGPRAGGPPQPQRPGGPGRHGPRGAGPAQLRHPGARLRRGGVAGGAGRPAGGDRGRLLQPPGGPRPGAAPQPRRDPLVRRAPGAPLGNPTRPAPGSRWGPSPRGTGRPRRAC